MTIYLYVKIHTKTKLKYFGKTTRNVNRYHGSGKHWQRHIKQHGTEHVKTLRVWKFESLHECASFALKFSKDNNIVNSVHWANLIEENGNDGAPVGHPGCVGSKNGMFGKSAMLGKKHKEESKKLVSEKLKGREFTSEWREKISKAKLGKTFTEEHKNKMRGPRGPLNPEIIKARVGKKRGPYKSKTSKD